MDRLLACWDEELIPIFQVSRRFSKRAKLFGLSARGNRPPMRDREEADTLDTARDRRSGSLDTKCTLAATESSCNCGMASGLIEHASFNVNDERVQPVPRHAAILRPPTWQWNRG